MRGTSVRIRGARGSALLLALAAVLALGSGGCFFRPGPPSRSQALRHGALGPVVDSIVVPPFTTGPGVQINAADLALFRDQFEAQLLARPTLRAYPAAPTTLANTVILTGSLRAFDVGEQTGEGMFLRTISMIVDVDVRIGAETEPALKLSRPYSYQKLYRSTQGVAALEYDLHNAAREATGTLAELLVPMKAEAPRLESAVDATSGTNYSHPWLVRGNREAGFERYDNAIAAWSLLLYNPQQPGGADRFRVSDRTLARLRGAGAEAPQIEALKPLTRRSGATLEDLRDRVVKALGPNSPLEPKVLQWSDESVDRVQLNLARAHFNLAGVYQRERRLDVAAYHLARAYGFDPTQAYQDAWVALQTRRELIPPEAKTEPVEGQMWLLNYLRVPAPFTATVSGGKVERTVMPAPAFQPAATPVRAIAPAQRPADLEMPMATPLPPANVGSPGKAPGAVPSRNNGLPAPRPTSKPPQRLGY